MVNTGGDERFEKFKTSSKFKPVQRNKKSKVKIDKRFKSMLQKVCSFFAFRQSKCLKSWNDPTTDPPYCHDAQFGGRERR